MTGQTYCRGLTLGGSRAASQWNVIASGSAAGPAAVPLASVGYRVATMSDARRHLAIAPAPLGGAEARTLIARLNAELTERYPNAADRHFGLTEEQVTGGSGVFLVATLDGEPVGCGAL